MRSRVLVAACLLALPAGPVRAQSPYLVKDINPGVGVLPDTYATDLTAAGGLLFLKVCEPYHGCELWMSDGTEAGTRMVKDINPGSGNSLGTAFFLPYLTDVNGMLFFMADDGLHGRELWKSDGTEAGTVMVKDIEPGPVGSSDFSDLVDVDGTLFFQAGAFRAGGAGRELWKSDGTETGTVMVKDINPGFGGSYPAFLTNANGEFSAYAMQGEGTTVDLVIDVSGYFE